MSYSDLPSVDRAEIDALILNAHHADDGSIRTRRDALAAFDVAFADAVQHGRDWPYALEGGWRSKGMADFISGRWKALGGRVQFRDPATGAAIPRPVRRGVRRIDDSARPVYVQTELPLWTLDQLRLELDRAERAIEDAVITAANLRKLIGLMESTGEATVQRALDVTGQSLDDFLLATSP